MAILLVIAIFLDRISKAVIGVRPDFYQPVIGDHFVLLHSLNSQGPLGLNFEINFLLALAIVVLLAVSFFLYLENKYVNRILWLAIFAGVLSNTVDRFMYGYVIDVFRLTPGLIFNIADVMLVVGVVSLFFIKWNESRR